MKPQEIRNAVYRGNIVEELKTLNSNPKWHAVLGLRNADKNQKDIEIILRLFSLYEVWKTYEKPMLKYLNRQMNENRDFDADRAKRFKKRFPEVVNLINSNLARPFRPRGVLNSAMLEGVMIALLENDSITADELESRYDILSNDPTFEKYLRGATTDTINVRERIKRAKELLDNASA